MQHLAREYDRIKIPVELCTKLEQCTPISSLTEFYAFPRQNGWSIGDDYGLNEPTAEELNGAPAPRMDKATLLQSWLFFGLLSLVVRNDQRPFLEFEKLLDIHTNAYIDTTNLVKALDDWVDWELSDKRGAIIRLARAELALEYAYRFVRKNCIYDIDESNDIQSNEIAGSNEVDQEVDKVDDVLNLSLMVLGETLCSAKARIVDGMGFQMRGWHRRDEGGWGPPAYVFKKMREKKWCKRTVHLLQGQLGANAILLLAAFESREHLTVNDTHEKKKCNKNACLVISGGKAANDTEMQSSYQPLHDDRCLKQQNCQLIGPDMAKIYEILGERNDENEGKEFPILEVCKREDESLSINVSTWSSAVKTPFATISHVWSDGLGNEGTNKIYYCQLKLISRLLSKIARNGHVSNNPPPNTIPFWLDTLLIPVKGTDHIENFDDLKKRAIRQIPSVFNNSTDSIVIDKDLLIMDREGPPWKTIMKILGSGWMRRLWTLQEAYLSKRLWVPFKPDRDLLNELTDLDKLIGSLGTELSRSSEMAEMAKLKLFQNIMGNERAAASEGAANERDARSRDPYIHNESTHISGRSILIANTWRAARWRTTSNPAHEVLALATLLNLNYRTTSSISEAGLIDRTAPVGVGSLSNMMRDFWKIIQRDMPGSIPPGMIFLPGEKLPQEGFRWAPMTWMSALKGDHPDPLGSFPCTTELHERLGLLVQYPGFLLHCQDRKILIGTNQSEPVEFTFPIDRDLLEWYSVKDAERKIKPYIHQILDQSNGNQSDLAIILSRSRPREMPSEIGLLVQIYEKKAREAPADPNRIVFHCRTIHRVRVCRTKPMYSYGILPNSNEQGVFRRRNTGLSIVNDTSPSLLAPSDAETDSQICIGELIEPDQQWFVDSFAPSLVVEPESEESIEDGPSQLAKSVDVDTPMTTEKPEEKGYFRRGFDSLFRKNPNTRPPQEGLNIPPDIGESSLNPLQINQTSTMPINAEAASTPNPIRPIRRFNTFDTLRFVL